jgi:hypothetical protein
VTAASDIEAIERATVAAVALEEIDGWLLPVRRVPRLRRREMA